MAEHWWWSPRKEDFTSKEERLNKIRRNSRSVKGFITKYILNTRTVINSLRLKRVAFGDEDKRKPHRTILLIGETGEGKSTIINAMVSYMLGFSSEDRIWCEITETKKPQTDPETNAVTVYDVYPEQSPCSLTVIDLYRFGETEDPREESNIVEGLLRLFKSTDGVSEIDAVCLVVPSNTNRLSEGQLHYLDDILSLFSSDVEENIVVFITYEAQTSTNAVKAIKGAKLPCAQTDKGEPVYFRFESFHCQNFTDEKILAEYEASWELLKNNMERFLIFVKESKTISIKNTETLLKNCKQLASSIFNLKDRITLTEFTINELEQTKEALQQLEKDNEDKDNFKCEIMKTEFMINELEKTKEALQQLDEDNEDKDNVEREIMKTEFMIKELEKTKEALQQLEKDNEDKDNFECEIKKTESKIKELEEAKLILEEHFVDKIKKINNFECKVHKPYKEKEPRPYYWLYKWTKSANCCEICEENCHYPECWWTFSILGFSLCSVMSHDETCTVCTRKCSYKNHVKDGKVYVVKTREHMVTLEELKKKYNTRFGEIKSLINMIENEVKKQKRQKIRLAEECHQCMIKLDEIGSKRDYYVSILPNVDFLILKMMEIGQAERVWKLQELKTRAQSKSQTRPGWFW